MSAQHSKKWIDLLSPVLSLLLPWLFVKTMLSRHALSGSLNLYLPSILGILCIGYIISAASSPSNIIPRMFLRSDHPYRDLIYFKSKSFAFHLAPLLPVLLFLFTSIVYIELPDSIGRGIAYAVFGMVTAHALMAYYFSKEIGQIHDDISLRIFLTGLLKRFTVVSTITLIAILVFFYTVFFALSEDKSITKLSPFRIFGDTISLKFNPKLLARFFGLAAALYLINLPLMWRKRAWLVKADYALIFLCALLWATAVTTATYFVQFMVSLSGSIMAETALNFLLHHLLVLAFVLVCSLCISLAGPWRTIKNLQQPVWHYRQFAPVLWWMVFTVVFMGSLFYTESSVYSIIASTLLFGAVCYAMLSKKRLEDLIQERTYDLNQEKIKVDSLLSNILPAYVIEDLKMRGESLPRDFENVAILFTDFVGFTRISTTMEPSSLINELNEMFTAFDDIVLRRGGERIKTIGDAYMAVSGLNESVTDPAAAMVESAQDIIAYIRQRNQGRPVQWQIRIGISVGKSVGGVVGKTKYLFDLFGDTINTASRMESNSEPMKINVSEEVYLRLKDRYPFVERELVEVKGKGLTKMYFVDSDV
jgi:class 3 adenylate cyclase